MGSRSAVSTVDGSGGSSKGADKVGGAETPYGRRFAPREQWLALTATVREEALQITGPCPVCTHDLDDFVSLSPDWLRQLKRDGATARIETVVACNCDNRHENRPETALGCGTIAVLTAFLTGTECGVTATIGCARKATARDRSWDEDAARWEREKAERVGAIAERWSATIAALFAIFGGTLVLSGDRVSTAAASDASWPWWVLGGLLATIVAASLYGWLRRDDDEPVDVLLIATCAVSAVAALVAITWAAIAGVPVDGGPTFGILAALAVVFALAATGFAGFAAQGSPRWVNYLTGNRMRQLRMESADRTMRSLRRARLATIVAVTGLVATLAVFWYAPVPDTHQVVVQTTAGDEYCGALLSYGEEGLAFDPEGSEQRRRVVPTAQLAAVRVVETC